MRVWSSHQRSVEVEYDREGQGYWVRVASPSGVVLHDFEKSPVLVVQKVEYAGAKLPKDIEWMLSNDAYRGSSPTVNHGYVPGNCPQCGGQMKEQCGETCRGCGFHLSCSAEP